MNKFRISLITIMATIGILCSAATFYNSAHAACAALWNLTDESISYCSGTSKDGTFSSSLEEDASGKITVTITLNNYKGGAFYLEGYGTGIDVSKYIIKLVGSNEITFDEANQEYDGEIDYALTGDGQLIVKSTNGVTKTLTASPDNEPTPETPTTTSTPTEPTAEDVETEPENTTSVWDTIVWFAVRVAIFGGIIIAGILVVLVVLHLRNKNSPRKPTKKH